MNKIKHCLETVFGGSTFDSLCKGAGKNDTVTKSTTVSGGNLISGTKTVTVAVEAKCSDVNRPVNGQSDYVKNGHTIPFY